MVAVLSQATVSSAQPEVFLREDSTHNSPKCTVHDFTTACWSKSNPEATTCNALETLGAALSKKKVPPVSIETRKISCETT